MKTLLSCAVAVLCFRGALAQTPYLVKDINTSYTPNAVSSSPRFFAAAGSTVLFSAASDATGTELFKTDGATAELVRDIQAGPAGSAPSNIVPLSGSTVVFAATDPLNGRELWASDGTEAGTVLIKDIYVGGQGSYPLPLAAMSGRMFFTASSTGQTPEAWVTDGTEAGTRKLVDSPNAAGFAAMGGSMYFYSGSTLWRSDGTPEGTTAVRTDVTIRTITATADRLFFAGWDSAHGYELWISDGTTGGTMLLKDINPGAASAFNTTVNFSLVNVGSSVVFFAFQAGTGWSLWRSDGTANGTYAYKGYPAWQTGTIPPFLSAAGGLAYFSLSGVWRTDGSDPGTIQLGTGTDPSWFVTGASKVFFFARSTTGAFRLWSTDGSSAGTSIVTTFVTPGSPAAMAAGGGAIYFSGSDGATGWEPWVSDGTEGGTHLIANLTADPPASSNPESLVGTAGRAFFTAHDGVSREIWTSDGSGPGTVELTDFLGLASFQALSPWKGKLFFTTWSTSSGSSQYSLRVSDGTAPGSLVLRNEWVPAMFPSSGYFYFAGGPSSGTSSYRRLWRSDGTEAGTVEVVEGAAPIDPSGFVEVAGRVYFEAGDPRGIWQTEGTAETTLRLTTHPSSYTSISAGPVASSGALYYSLHTSTYGTELWRTDVIRRSNTVLDVLPGTPSSTPDLLTAAGPLVFFTAIGSEVGRELWRSDGTPAGTFVLTDLAPGTASSQIRSLTAVGRRLFFVASNGIDGYELWTSDGSVFGTIMVADIAPGSASSSPEYLTSADGLLWFSADDGSNGRELWMSDGTAMGTQRVADLNPGTASSAPRALAVTGRQMFFTAETSNGRELWSMALNPISYAVHDALVVEGNAGTALLRFKVRRAGDLSSASTVAFATSNGSATAGSDYTAASGTVTFASGDDEEFIDVTVNGDTELENNESLFVAISSPSAGVIETSEAIGTIEEDDRSAGLSVQIVQTTGTWETGRTYIVTNSGPSDADGVVLRFTESPTIANLSGAGCSSSGYGVLLCSVGTLVPGESRTVVIGRYVPYSGTLYDTANPPGYTITATVTSLTPDTDPSDNTIARMTTNEGSLLLPPFLVSNVPATLGYLAAYVNSSSTAVSITSSNPGVVVTPAVANIPGNERYASFTLQPGDITGKTRLTAGTYGQGGPSLTVAIVAPATEAKLDVAWVSSATSYVKYPGDVTITARVAARAADGAYPTGPVSLLDAQQAVVAQATPDPTGSVKFVRSGLQPGNYAHSIRFEGDVRFEPLTVALGSIRVEPYNTVLRLFSAPVACGNTIEATAIVRTSETADAPTGTVNFSAGSTIVVGTLVPTGNNGESSTTVQLPVTSSTSSFSATYAPTGPFAAGWNEWRTISVGCDSSMNLVATATASNRVALTWTGSAPTWEVHRFYHDGYSSGWSLLGYAAGTTYLDTTAVPAKSYLYRVRPTTSLAFSAPDLATTVLFTDDPIVPQVTAVKALHFTQLLAAVNSVRQLAGLSSVSFTSTPAFGAAITTAPMATLRPALAQALPLVVGRQVTLTDPTLAAGMLIRAVHVQELRDATK